MIIRKLLSISFIIVLVFISCQAQEEKRNGIIILGSYHAYFMDWEDLKSFRKNSSVPDFTSQQLGWTLKYNVINDNPQCCILQTGPEDLLLGISPEQIIENISNIHSELSRDSIDLVILSGIQNPKKKSLGSVINLNKEIELWATENEIPYIDISDIVARPEAFDEDFKIRKEFQEKIVKRVNRKLAIKKKQ